MNNATATIRLYHSWVNSSLNRVEATRMMPIIRELQEMAQMGDATPGAADLMACTTADALLRLLADTTGETLDELQSFVMTQEQAVARVRDESNQSA